MIDNDSDRPGVMISSTSLDLPEHRKRAIDAVWRAGFFPLAMERDEADSSNAIDYSTRLVNQSRVYIGIFGFRYGHIPEGQTASITEMEYRRAAERNIPILIFIMSDDHDIKYRNVESDPDKAKRLAELKIMFTSKYKVAYFKSVDELAFQILDSLFNLKESGQVRVQQRVLTSRGSALRDVPQAPKPFIAHPFILTRRFFGRQQELRALDGWVNSKDSTIIVDAIGGVGKSALAWEWMQTRVIGPMAEFAGVVWWSFYESDASVENLMRRALQYVTGMTSDELSQLSSEAQEATLLQALATKRVLFVLDGLERILTAYNRLDAAQLSDAEVERLEQMPGTSARRCMDWRHGEFLRKLATLTVSKVLITTRLSPIDLTDRHTGRLLQGVREIKLSGLDADDALTLMQSLGVRGNAEELKLFMKRFGFHSLLLGIVAGRIINYHPAPGNFDVWFQAEAPRFTIGDLELSQRRSHILKYALDGLSPDQRTLLSQIAAFRFPVEYDALSVLNPFKSPKATASTNTSSQLSARAQFDVILTELESRGLMQWDRASNRYDLHPVVRAIAFGQLGGAARTQTFDLIRDYFRRLPPEDVSRVQSVDDLRRTLEIYYALVGAGHYQDASDLYDDRLNDALLHRLAAYPLAFEVLASLFPLGLNHPPAIMRQSAERMTNMAYVLHQLGDSENAHGMMELIVSEGLKTSDVSAIIQALINYADTLLDLNRLAQASQVYGWAHRAAIARGGSETINVSLVQILRLNVIRGEWKSAENCYKLFRQRHSNFNDRLGRDAERHYAEMLVTRRKSATHVLARVWAASVNSGDALAQRSTLFLMTVNAMNHGDLDAAREYMLGAIASAQRSGMQTGPYIVYLAHIAAMRHQFEDATALLQEAILGGARYVNIAEVLQMLNRPEEAVIAARLAYQEAWADGKPYCRMWALERATTVLQTLHQPHPDLPPFDWQSIPVLPIQGVITQFVTTLEAGNPWRGASI